MIWCQLSNQPTSSHVKGTWCVLHGEANSQLLQKESWMIVELGALSTKPAVVTCPALGGTRL